MIDKSLLIKLRTMARAFWHLIVSIWRISITADNWRELSKFCGKIWKDKSVAYNSLAQDGDKKKRIPLKKGILSLPGGNSETGRIIRILLMASFSSMIIGGGFAVLMLHWGSFTWGSLILIIILILLLLIIPILNHQVNTYSLGHLGERVVAEELNNLLSRHGFPSRQWHFFHSFFPEETNKGDIDHVIVCPKGVFCVETKTWRKNNGGGNIIFKNGVLTINGTPNDKITKQVESNAERMRRFLEQKCDHANSVKSIITFPGWWLELSNNTPDAIIFAINPEQFYAIFHEVLSQQPDTLNQEQIDKISQVIKDRDRTSLKQLNEMLS